MTFKEKLITSNVHVNVSLGDSYKENRHKTKVTVFTVEIHVDVLNIDLNWKGRCHLDKNGNVSWIFSKEYPISIKNLVESLYTSKEVSELFQNMTKVKSL